METTKPKHTKQSVIATAERRLRKLDIELTDAISNVLNQKGWSRQELAAEDGSNCRAGDAALAREFRLDAPDTLIVCHN